MRDDTDYATVHSASAEVRPVNRGPDDVYDDLKKELQSRFNGDPEFLGLIADMVKMHCKKSSDYANQQDRFANFSACQRFGVDPALGAMVRLSDKWERIVNLTLKEQAGLTEAVDDESIEDTLMDFAAYSLIILCLRRRKRPQAPESVVMDVLLDRFLESDAGQELVRQLAREYVGKENLDQC